MTSKNQKQLFDGIIACLPAAMKEEWIKNEAALRKLDDPFVGNERT